MLLSILLFLDFSGGEFMLIAVVFLMFFGSKSIPGMARTFGKAVRDFKEAANTVQREISESVNIEEFKQPSPPSSSTTTIQANPPASSVPLQATPPASSIAQETTKVEIPKTDPEKKVDTE